MADLLSFKCIPAGSILVVPPEDRESLLEELGNFPEVIRGMLTNLRTGFYLRGLVKSVGLSIEQAPVVALLVLKVATGVVPLAQLASLLSSGLQITNSQAQAVAKDIEKELFGPVMVELNQYLRSKQDGSAETPTEPPERTVSGPNVLDLRRQ